MSTRTALTTFFIALTMVACTDDDEAADAGPDAGAPDAGIADGASPDGAPEDAGAPPDTTPAAPTWPASLDLRPDAWFLRKAYPLRTGGVVALMEMPRHLHQGFGLPRRELRWFTADGTLAQSTAPPPERYLIDVAAHPNDEFTILLSSDTGYRLSRLGPDGEGLGFHDLQDPQIGTDPPALAPGAPSGPITEATRDAGRLAAQGNAVVLATRTGRESVVVYRYVFAAGSFQRLSRTLALPAYPIQAIGLTGGSYDTFGQVESQYAVHLAVDDRGTIYVGVRYPELTAQRLARVVRDVFQESPPTDDDFLDSWVVRMAPDGRRLGTSTIHTAKPDELYGLRAGRGGVYAVGRNEIWNAAGTGFDALVARLDGATGAVTVRELDVERSDIAFDVAEVPGGGLVVVGASGYTQNPQGASISEESAAFARWLPPDGRVVPLSLPTAPRHNEARFVVFSGPGRITVGGMQDGPGTHSADADARLLRARGFLTHLVLPRE